MSVEALFVLINEIRDLDAHQQRGAGDQDQRIAIESAHGGLRQGNRILGSDYVYRVWNAIVGGGGLCAAEPGHDFQSLYSC